MSIFNTMNGKMIIIEGLIGAGKSTLCIELVKHFKSKNIKCKYFPEVVNIDFLNLYISNMKKYSFAFQLFMLNERIKVLKNAEDWTNRTGGYAIIDRSLHGDFAFGFLQKLNGNMTDKEWDVYQNVLSQNALLRKPDVIFFLNVSIDNCLKRTRIRDRTGEDNYTREYFEKLAYSYDECMKRYCQDKIIHIEWNGPIDLTCILTHI